MNANSKQGFLQVPVRLGHGQESAFVLLKVGLGLELGLGLD